MAQPAMGTFGLSAALGAVKHLGALRCPQGCGVLAGGTVSCGSRGAASSWCCGHAAGGLRAALLGLSLREWLRDPCSRHAIPLGVSWELLGWIRQPCHGWGDCAAAT